MDKQIRRLWMVLVICAASQVCRAQSTIGYGAGIGQRDVYFQGAPVPDGNQVQIGFFNSGFDVLGNAGNILPWPVHGTNWTLPISQPSSINPAALGPTRIPAIRRLMVRRSAFGSLKPAMTVRLCRTSPMSLDTGSFQARLRTGFFPFIAHCHPAIPPL